MANPCPSCETDRGDSFYMHVLQAWVYQCPACERVDSAGALDMETLGSNFRKRRRRLFKRQYEFADRIGVNRETVNRWEQGKKPIPEWAWAMLVLMEENQRLQRKLKGYLALPSRAEPIASVYVKQREEPAQSDTRTPAADLELAPWASTDPASPLPIYKPMDFSTRGLWIGLKSAGLEMREVP